MSDADATKARVRFAPSPTGLLHVGNARTALFNWAYARAAGGTMILRIEDTDLRRSSDESAGAIMEDLRWLGIDWDEGPDVGGPVGPYVQSRRIDLYRKYAAGLVDRGLAYRCYCTEKELLERRNESLKRRTAPRYDNRCRELAAEQVRRYQAEGRTPVLRFRVDEKELEFRDMVKGEVRFDTALLGDFVIMRPDGVPAFHFAVTVDDGLMGITHVIRGDDHLSNTPRHIMLFRALGFSVPRFAHMSLTMGKGGVPLSKRDGDVSIASFRSRGYLPQALANYIALLGWSPGKGKEIFPLRVLAEKFSPDQLSGAPAVFDPAKLRWVARQYMRAADASGLAAKIRPWLEAAGIDTGSLAPDERDRLRRVIGLVKDEVENMEEAARRCVPFLREDVPVAGEDLSLLCGGGNRALLEEAAAAAEFLDGTEGGALKFMERVGEKTGLRGKSLYAPLRMALTGEAHGIELKEILRLLGKTRALSRLEDALVKCGGGRI